MHERWLQFPPVGTTKTKNFVLFVRNLSELTNLFDPMTQKCLFGITKKNFMTAERQLRHQEENTAIISKSELCNKQTVCF
jgi:hypothetical protein